MLRLLSTDLKRMLKDKLFIIVMIIGFAFGVITPLLYKGIIAIMEFAMEEDLSSMYYAKDIVFGSLGPMSDFGLIMPILISIIVYKDFSYGTIRNKIITGKSRLQVYLSLFLSSAILICVAMLAYALVTMGVSLLLFDYSAVAFTASEFGYIVVSLLFMLLCYLFVAAIICFFCIAFKNVGLSIVFYFLLGFIGQLVAALLGSAIEVLIAGGKSEILVNFLEFINNCNVFYLITMVIGKDVTYIGSEIAACILTPVIFASLITVLGIVIFRRKDIK